MELLTTMKKAEKTIEKAFLPFPDEGTNQDVLDTLKQEHDEVKELLNQLVKSESGATRKSLLKKIKLALVPHSRAEEKVVYNAIIAKKDNEAKIDGEEGYHEHGLADKMIATLSKISSATSPQFSAGAKVLKELIEHHISEEEKNVWKDVRKHFTTDQRVKMNIQFLKDKKKVRIS